MTLRALAFKLNIKYDLLYYYIRKGKISFEKKIIYAEYTACDIYNDITIYPTADEMEKAKEYIKLHHHTLPKRRHKNLIKYMLNESKLVDIGDGNKRALEYIKYLEAKHAENASND